MPDTPASPSLFTLYTVEAVKYRDGGYVTRAEVWPSNPTDRDKLQHPLFASEANQPVTDCREWAQANGIFEKIIYN